jgi:predicted enzyme related to lactoylglutathione lyase
MKRFHVHVSVDDLAQSIRFYSTLFAVDPTRNPSRRNSQNAMPDRASPSFQQRLTASDPW